MWWFLLLSSHGKGSLARFDPRSAGLLETPPRCAREAPRGPGGIRAGKWPRHARNAAAGPGRTLIRASFKASNEGCVVRDHPGELSPRLSLGEDCVKVLFHRGCAFHGDPPFLFREGLRSDGCPEARSREQLPDCLVVPADLQAADEVGCRPGLEAMEPLPRPGHIERMRNEVLAPTGWS